ncbi:MAG: restriction endonuclease subunit S [Candidatus Binatia bacterium]
MTGARKHTVAGNIPDEWDAKLIKNCCDVVRGASPRPAGDPRYFDGDYLPWITVADVTGMPGMYLDGTRTKLTKEGANFTRLIPPATLIITNSGATLGVPKITRELSGANDGIAVFLNLKDVSKECLFYILESKTEYFRNELAPGVGQPNLNTELLGDVAIPIPPPGEQETIVGALSTWDTAIQKTEQLIAAKERHHSTLIHRLITAPSKSESWRHSSIRDIADRVQRQGDGADYPLLTISSASGFVRQEDRYSRYMAGESAKTYTLLRAGEFSYNKGNSKRYEFGCVFQLQGYDAALVPNVYVSFKLHEAVCAAYMRHLFAADYLKPQLRALVKTGVRNNGLLNIRPDEFMGTTVPLPPPKEQARIAKVLDAASSEIDLLRKQLVALRVQKRGLMQKLLTGQWRLPAQEKAVSA